MTCDCDPTLIRPSASPWTCPHGNVWRLGVPGDPYCWTLEPRVTRRAEPEPDNEGLPPGFVPAWTFIKTEDGVVEYDHPAADLLTEGTDNDD